MIVDSRPTWIYVCWRLSFLLFPLPSPSHAFLLTQRALHATSGRGLEHQEPGLGTTRRTCLSAIGRLAHLHVLLSPFLPAREIFV